MNIDKITRAVRGNRMLDKLNTRHSKGRNKNLKKVIILIIFMYQYEESTQIFNIFASHIHVAQIHYSVH
jgi:hypothetical protein